MGRLVVDWMKDDEAEREKSWVKYVLQMWTCIWVEHEGKWRREGRPQVTGSGYWMEHWLIQGRLKEEQDPQKGKKIKVLF
jgi:hypothetical protein